MDAPTGDLQTDPRWPELLAVCAHEVRSPLTPVLGHLDMLLKEKSGPLTEQQRHTLERISGKLGFNETQTVLFALARLRDQVLQEAEAVAFSPLTRQQHAAIAKAAPAKRGKIIESLLP